MRNIERRDQQILYISDESVMEEQKKCRAILQKLNFMDRADFEGIAATVKELLGSSDSAFINPPFYCDYGSHIHVGKTSLPITTAPSSTWRRLSSETTARWRRMWRSTPPGTRSIRQPAIPCTSTARPSRSGTMCGSAGIPSSARACTSETIPSSEPAVW